MSEMDWLRAHDAWSKRALVAEAQRDALVKALQQARARIEYLGVCCLNSMHYESNEKTFLPAIDRVLSAVGSPTNGK